MKIKQFNKTISVKEFLRVLVIACMIMPGFTAWAQTIKANVARVNLTPPTEMQYTLGGYGERMNRPAEGVHDSIYVKALVLKTGEKKFALLTLDILALPNNVKTDLLARIAKHGWSEENLMLLPSHSHGSLEMAALNSKNQLGIPQIGLFQKELLDLVIDKMEEAIVQADQNLEPVSIGSGSIELNELNRNRRGDPAVDRQLTVTRIDRMDGTTLAALVNWTAHPTFIGGDDMLVSAEWPGYLQSNMEQAIGGNALVMYYNGAEGDQSPICRAEGSAYEKIQSYGKQIATWAMEVYNAIETRSDCRMEYVYKTMELPPFAAHPDFMKSGGDEYGLTEESVQVVMAMLAPRTTGIGVLRLGDMLLAGIPGEMDAGLGLQIKAALKTPQTPIVCIGGLANEWISYIISEDQYHNGAGYESSVSFYGPGLGSLMVKEAIEAAKPLSK